MKNFSKIYFELYYYTAKKKNSHKFKKQNFLVIIFYFLFAHLIKSLTVINPELLFNKFS